MDSALTPAVSNDFAVPMIVNVEGTDRLATILSLLAKRCDAEALKQIEANFMVLDNEEIITTLFNIDFRVKSFCTLRPGIWLDDQVINVMMEFFNNSATQTVHFFNSFFFFKLCGCDYRCDLSTVFNYEEVHSWTGVNKVDVFTMSRIIFPVNITRSHWVLLLIDLRSKRICFYDSLVTRKSYAAAADFFLDAALRWLKCEHLQKRLTELPDENMWRLLKMGKEEGTPQQNNGYDCGVCTIMNAFLLGEDLPLTYGPSHLSLFRRSIALSILRGSLWPVVS